MPSSSTKLLKKEKVIQKERNISFNNKGTDRNDKSMLHFETSSERSG